MKMHIAAVAALAGSILLTPVVMEQAKAGHGGGGLGGAHVGGMGGPHFGGMGGPHFGGMGGAHVGGMGGARFTGGRIAGAHVGGDWHGGHFSNGSWGGGARHLAWNSGPAAWHGGQSVWRGHNHDHFVHDHHDHFHNRFVAVGLGGWPSYYGYGYGGCGWLHRQALTTGNPYWWDRYYACANDY